MSGAVAQWPSGPEGRARASADAGAAAAAATAEASPPASPPAPQQRRGRGRPPGLGGDYTKKYLSVKRYREKKKSMMAQLEAEVVDKLAQVKLLMAENDALQTRERVLQTVIDGGEGRMRQLEEEEARQDWQRAEAGRVVDRALSSGNSGSCPCRVASSSSSSICGSASEALATGGREPSDSSAEAAAAAVAAAATAAAAAAAAAVTAAEGPSEQAASAARLAAFCQRYNALVAHIRARRLRRDGRVRPAAAGDPLAAEPFELVQLALAMPPEDSYALLTTNAETGQSEAHPPDLHGRVARALKLSPKQQACVLAAWRTFEAALARLKADRAALLDALASMQQHLDGVPAPAGAPAAEFARAQAVETGISRVLQSADHEAIALALEDNMSRENQQWGIMTGTLALLLEEHQLAHIAALSHPYMLSLTQVAAQYVAEVLGHKPAA
ncbi:hypothetical protein Rsub_10746 [Raphidocelis subcapitata]|uniref:BZIP domain-containing protein n=1 Tax=Raphidocelis subcapitata TaxID=307507 RepID=A0A2V0PI87_9CHLO|nr:hypothetical protein Rsub_10746 [Raphidocelis subcapitata]|eukprot:GBF97610.1 hypothetical protein Rsub_10746 [Raphidocelis subcapitata]